MLGLGLSWLEGQLGRRWIEVVLTPWALAGSTGVGGDGGGPITG